MKTIVTTCALIAVLAASSAFAGVTGLASSANVRTCELESTDAGFDVSAKGVARFTKSLRGEAVAVQVSAKLEDKSMLIVSVTTGGKTFDIGSFHMLLGVGLFEMQTFRDGFSHAFPVDDIEGVSVRIKDTVLLQGQCRTPSSGL